MKERRLILHALLDQSFSSGPGIGQVWRIIFGIGNCKLHLEAGGPCSISLLVLLFPASALDKGFQGLERSLLGNLDDPCESFKQRRLDVSVFVKTLKPSISKGTKPWIGAIVPQSMRDTGAKQCLLSNRQKLNTWLQMHVVMPRVLSPCRFIRYTCTLLAGLNAVLPLIPNWLVRRHLSLRANLDYKYFLGDSNQFHVDLFDRNGKLGHFRQ